MKTNFKILFPTGYQYEDILNDNIDINVILETGEVYFGVAYTIANVQSFMDYDNKPYFWGCDMLIVADLSETTLMESVTWLVNQGILDNAFSKIGHIGDENDLYKGVSFDSIVNMGTGYLTERSE